MTMLICASRRRPGGGPAPSFGQGLYFDRNSLTNSRLWLPDWLAQRYQGIYTPTITRFVDEVDGEMALVNALANSPDFGTIFNQFTCPAGVTEVTLELKIKLPVGATPNSINCGIFLPDFSGYVNGALLTVTPTGTLVTHTLVYSGLTPGVTYYPIFNFNYPAQAPCLVKSLRIIPSNGDGIFGTGDFTRLQEAPGVALYDGQPEVYFTPGVENVHRASSNTRYPIQTDATDFVCELYNQSEAFPEYVGVGVNVNSAFSELLWNHTSLSSFSSGTGSAQRVEMIIGQLWKGVVPGAGTWPRALYVGPCTTLYNPGELAPSAQKYLVIGDSVTCGFYGDPCQGAWSLLTNAGRAKGVLRACAGQALFDTCPTPEAATAYVALFSEVDFDAFYISVGANDAVSGAYGGVAGWQAAMEDFVDKCHAAFPSKPVYLQSLLVWATDGALPQSYRDAMQAIALARPWATYIDGFAFLDASDLIDAYHPGVPGTTKLANAIGTALGV